MNGKLGSAAWEEPGETERNNQWRPGTIWLGRSVSGLPLGYGDDRHVSLVAGNRSGKGTNIILPALLTWSGSMMVIDPKGENATIAAGRRGRGARYEERRTFLKQRKTSMAKSRAAVPDYLSMLREPYSFSLDDSHSHPTWESLLRRISHDPPPEKDTTVEDVAPGGDGLGQAVYVLDPFRVANVDETVRARFNPLDEIDPRDDNALADAGLIADALVVVRENVREPFFDESARTMVKALILHVLTAPKYEGRRNLTTVRQLALRGDWEMAEILRDASEETAPPHGLLWQAVSRNKAFGEELAGLGDSFANLLAREPKTFENILQSVNRNLEFMGEPQMQRVLEASDFRLADLKTDPRGVSVFLSLPQRYMNTHYRWLRMMISLTLARMGATPSPKGRPQVLLLLDEFAGLKRMDEVEKAVAQSAGLGVKMFFVLQSLEQLKSTYKDNWETFLANSGLKIFFGLGDHFSREYVSKLIGEMELARETVNSSNTQSENESLALGASSNRTTSRSVANGASRTETDSTNWGDSHTSGSSSGVTFGPPTPLGIFGPRITGMSSGSFSSSTSTSGESHGVSNGTSRTETESESDASGNSLTSTRGNGVSQMAGRSETLHRRPLIHPDEIGRQFARVGRDDPAYPGLALIIEEGRQPAPVRRVNYYEDYEFMGLFDPHPDHNIPAVRGAAVRAGYLHSVGASVEQWLVGEGAQVRQGDAVALVRLPLVPERIALRAPRTGVVTAVRPQVMMLLRLNVANLQPEGNWIMAIAYYPALGEEREIDPFADIRAAATLSVLRVEQLTVSFAPPAAIAAPAPPPVRRAGFWESLRDFWFKITNAIYDFRYHVRANCSTWWWNSRTRPVVVAIAELLRLR
jgi:type IV secretory pathway TraG/TraD family ATPase VirD4